VIPNGPKQAILPTAAASGRLDTIWNNYDNFTYLALVTLPLESALELDDNLKKLMKDLGDTINEALSSSDKIAAAIQNINDAGFSVFLVLEATIGVKSRSTEGQSDPGLEADDSDIQLKVNAQDMKFLKSLKIKIDDLGH
jgi:hypothetical protein